MVWRNGWLTCAAALFLAACATTDERPLTRIPAGSELQVNTTIAIPGNRARVHIQDGEVISRFRYDRFRAHCSIGLRRVERGDRIVSTIEPGVFTTGESRTYRTADAGSLDGTELASVALLPVAGVEVGSGRGGVVQLRFFTETRLHNPDQPQVHELRCVRDAWADTGRYLAVEEMQQTLEPLITLGIAGAQ